MRIVKHCPGCGKQSALEVPEAGYLSWMAGKVYASIAFPDLSREQIDQLLTGWHPACVEALEQQDQCFSSEDHGFDFYPHPRGLLCDVQPNLFMLDFLTEG